MKIEHIKERGGTINLPYVDESGKVRYHVVEMNNTAALFIEGAIFEIEWGESKEAGYTLWRFADKLV